LGDGRRLIHEIAEVVAMDFCLYASAPANGRFRAVHVTELPASVRREIILSLVRKIRFFCICRCSWSHVLERHEKTISQRPAQEILTVSILSVAARGGPSSLAPPPLPSPWQPAGLSRDTQWPGENASQTRAVLSRVRRSAREGLSPIPAAMFLSSRTD
jgi:hypothetical protein